MVIEFLLALGGAYWLAKVLEKRHIQQSGRRLREDLDSAFSAGHDFQSATAQDFHPYLDLGYYGQVQSELEREGFCWVDDIEDLTLSRQCPANRTFQRLMVTTDGKMRASIFHLKPRGKLYRFLSLFSIVPREYRSLEIATEFSGGFFILTNNTQGFPTLDLPPRLDVFRVDPQTPTSELVHLHRCRLERVLEENPEEPIHNATGRDDLLNAIERVLIMCQRFREEQGYSMDELQRIGCKFGSESALEELHRELNKNPET